MHGSANKLGHSHLLLTASVTMLGTGSERSRTGRAVELRAYAQQKISANESPLRSVHTSNGILAIGATAEGFIDVLEL